MLFDTDGKPSPALLEVLKITGVDHDGTLQGIRDSTQSTWYEAGKFRAAIVEQHAQLKTDLMPRFFKLGVIDPVQAKELEYDLAIVLGATLTAVRKRIAFLSKEWERGVRFRQIVLIGSSRKLMPDKEGPELLFKSDNLDLPFDGNWVNPEGLPETEGQMMGLVYDQIKNRLGWGEIPLTHSVHPGARANTAETFEYWLQEHKVTPCKCLLVSSQPFVADQELAACEVLKGFEVEAIGYGAPPSIPATTFLDALAKLIYKLAA